MSVVADARTRVRENQAAIRVGVAAPPLSFRRDTITASPTHSGPYIISASEGTFFDPRPARQFETAALRS